MAVVPELEVIAEPVRARTGMNTILFIVGAIILLGAIAGGAYYFFGHSAQAQQESADTDSKASSNTTKKKRKQPSAPAIYVALDPALVVNFESQGVMRFLQVGIQLSTRDPETSDALKLHDPVIRNELLMLMSNQDYQLISTREGKDTLRAAALAAVRGIIDAEGGDGEKVESLYFTSFVMQ